MSVERFAKKELLNIGESARFNVPPFPGLINLRAGDPDFDQPRFIADAVHRAMIEGYSHYIFGGDPDFKRAIADFYRKYGVIIDPEKQVLITSGGSQAIFHALAAILNPGDEVIVLDPAYQGYFQPAAYFGAKIVRAAMIKDDDGLFRINPGNIEDAASDRTKALIICNPDNPNGCVYTHGELEKVAELAIYRDFLVLSDEIYTEFIWGGRRHVSLIGLPGMEERNIVLASFSKTFAWTGCRAGYIIAGPELMNLISDVPIGICPMPVAFQKAGVEALKRGWGFVEEMRMAYEERIDYCVKRLNEMPGIRCPRPEGTFYIFPDISDLGMTSAEFVNGLLKEENLRIIPGTQYGAMGEGHVRLALVRPLKELKVAMDRFERYVKRLG